MTKTGESFNGKKLWLTLVFASILLAPIGISTNQAFAMGESPGTCPNRYDGPITSAKIIADGKIYDPIANPGVTFELATNKAYTVTFSIHTPGQSSQGNSDLGTTWYSDSINGFSNGHCVRGAGPNQDVIVTVPVIKSRSTAPIGVHPVIFSTLVQYPGIYYIVKWVYPSDPALDPPSNLIATAVSASQINLSWTAPPYPGSTRVIGYHIERSTDGGSSWSDRVYDTGSTATTFSDNFSLVHSTTYTYRVSALSFLVTEPGTSPPSNTASATTFNVVPSPPLGLTANAISSSQIDLRWSAPSDDGGSPITGYKVEKSSDGGTTWSTIVDNTGNTETTYSDAENVLSLTTYTYRVSAINSVGVSEPSDTASATTP